MPRIRNLSAAEWDRVGRRISRAESRSPLRNGAMLEGTFYVGGSARIVYEGDENSPEVPLATSSRNGLMPMGDKAKLDGSSSANTPNALVQRNANGHFNVPAPTASGHPVRQAEITAATAGVTKMREVIPASSDMDNILTPGDHHVLSNEVTTISNRPPTDAADPVLVEVHASDNGLVTQEWTRCRGSVQKWLRTRTIATDGWSAWTSLI